MADPVLTPNAWMRWDVVRRHLRDGLPTGRILEIGAGQGAVGARLAQRGRYTGVEPDPRSRAAAEARMPQGARMVADLADVDPAERFDLICAFEVLEHIEEHDAAVRDWVGRLAPGGALVLSVPAHQHRFAAADRAVGHLRRYGRRDLHAILEGSGLHDVHITATGFPFGYALEAGRNRIAARRADVAASVEEQTAASGRFLQPPAVLAPLTQALTLPFRLLQRPFRATDLGTGWVAVGRRAAP